jgi:hypothetical protein
MIFFTKIYVSLAVRAWLSSRSLLSASSICQVAIQSVYHKNTLFIVTSTAMDVSVLILVGRGLVQ